MKNYQFILSVLTFAMLSVSGVQAGEVTSTFSAGDTLTATHVTEIKDAVNDNNSRVGAIESQTQNLVSGCPAGQSIRAIAADGAVACEVDDSGSMDTLSGLACGVDEVAKFNGTSWACAEDIDTDTDTNTDTLNSLSCAANQVAKWDGSAWVCAADDDTGVIYTGGTGIDVTGTTISISTGGVTATEIAADAVTATEIADNAVGLTEINANAVDSSKIVDGSIVAADIDNTSVQQRLNMGCAAGSSIRDIAADGTPTCQLDADTDTTYSAGTGLTLTGTTFSMNTTNHVVIDGTLIGGSESYTGTTTFELLRTVSTYTKLSSTSTLLITYSDSLETDNSTGACTLSVRVNDVAPDGGSGAAPAYTTYLTTQTFFSRTGTFTGLAAGTHDINFYKRVLSSANCTRNSGNWRPTISIMEIEP